MSLGTEDTCRTHKTAVTQQIIGFLYWLTHVWGTDACPLETRGRPCNSFYPGHRWEASSPGSSIYFQGKQLYLKMLTYFHGVVELPIITARSHHFKIALDNTMDLKVCQPPNGISETFYDLQPPFQMIVHPPASSNYCHCCSISINLCFISQNPISKWTQRRASLPIETVSSMLVAVSGTVTRATAIFSKAPVAHETSIAVGARHTWLAVAESRLGVASPASAESCVGWTHWLAGASYGGMVRGDWDYVPRGHLVKWHFCKADKLVPSSLRSGQNW